MLMRYDYGMRSKFNKDLVLWCTFGTGRMRIAAAVLIDREPVNYLLLHNGSWGEPGGEF